MTSRDEATMEAKSLTDMLLSVLDQPTSCMQRHLECYVLFVGSALLIHSVKDQAGTDALRHALDGAIMAHAELLAVVGDLARRCGALGEVKELLQLAERKSFDGQVVQ